MARHLPSTALLNLGNVELEEVVQPLNKFLSARKKVIRQTIYAKNSAEAAMLCGEPTWIRSW